MTDVALLENDQLSGATSYAGTLLSKMEKIIHEHRQKDPDLYRMVEEKKLIKTAKQAEMVEPKPVAVANACSQKEEPLYSSNMSRSS